MRDTRHLWYSNDPRPDPYRCTVEGCGRTTREGKPWCSDHVVRHSSYAREIHAAVGAREDSDRGHRLAPELLQDARVVLAERPTLSVRGLARCLNVGKGTAHRIKRALLEEAA